MEATVENRKAKKISVLIPARNVSEYIDRAIQSVLCQTHSELEVLVIVNNSNDDTLQKVIKWSNFDNRVRHFDIGEAPGGITTALNFGLTLAANEYIARFDADDEMLPRRLEMQLNALIHNGLDLVGINFVWEINGRTRPLRIPYPVEQQKIERFCRLNNPIAHSWLCKKSLYDELGGYRSIAFCEDYDFIIRAILRGKRVENIREVLQIQLERKGNTKSVAYYLQLQNRLILAKAFRKRRFISENECFNGENYKKPSVLRKLLMKGLAKIITLRMLYDV